MKLNHFGDPEFSSSIEIYLNIYCMNSGTVWYRHSLSPEDEPQMF